MSLPNLTPLSTISAIILPSSGSTVNVNAGCPFKVYSDPASSFYSADFLSGAADQVAYTYSMLGGNGVDIELSEEEVYASYESSILEYCYLLNIHQAKNILSNVMGSATGTFDQDGTLKLTGSIEHANLKLPKMSFSYSRRVMEAVSQEAFVGAKMNEYSASFNLTAGQQDYDLQSIISSSAALSSSYDYYGLVNNKKVIITKVYYTTPSAMWRFFGYYGGMNVLGNLSSYGQFADDTTFQIVPVWENKLQAMAYEDAIKTRCSHYSYELRGNHVRIYPKPHSDYANPYSLWVNFIIPENPWQEETFGFDGTKAETGLEGVNNINTLPFENIPYENINAIGKMWIRRYALAISKEILGQVRGKFNPMPIPNGNITLNADALLSQAKDEQEKLREELKTILDQLTYDKLAERDANIMDSVSKVAERIPSAIFVG